MISNQCFLVWKIKILCCFNTFKIELQKSIELSTRVRRYISHEVVCLKGSGEASPTFGHANAIFSMFIDRIRINF